MTFIVTGHAGFIGYHVSRALLEKGHAVAGIDNLSDYYDVELKLARQKQLSAFENFRAYNYDLAQQSDVETVFDFEKPKVVINLAAQAGVRHSLTHPRDYLHSNLAGFLNVLEACRHWNVEHLLYASTSSVYGANEKAPFKEKQRTGHPLTLYAASKRANELMAHSYSHLYNIPSSGLRFFTVYGPWGRPDMAYFKFTKAIFDGTPIDIYGKGKMYRDFTYIDDIVQGITELVDHPPRANPKWKPGKPAPDSSGVAPFAIYNIGNSQVVKLLHFIDTLEEVIGKKAIRNKMPIQPGDVHLTSADTHKLHKVTGFKPDTPIREGLEKFVAWYREYYGV